MQRDKRTGVIFLAGPSASGKGTIADRLVREHKVHQNVSMGQILRELLQDKSEGLNTDDVFEKLSLADVDPGYKSGRDYLEAALVNGLLVPDTWTQQLIEAYIDSHPELNEGVWCLDGYPRRVQAAKHLMPILSRSNICLLGLVHLKVPKEELILRAMNRGRIDDNLQSIENRYTVYLEEVVPAINCVSSYMPEDKTANIVVSSDPNPVISKEENYKKVLKEIERFLELD